MSLISHHRQSCRHRSDILCQRERFLIVTASIFRLLLEHQGGRLKLRPVVLTQWCSGTKCGVSTPSPRVPPTQSSPPILSPKPFPPQQPFPSHPFTPYILPYLTNQTSSKRKSASGNVQAATYCTPYTTYANVDVRL